MYIRTINNSKVFTEGGTRSMKRAALKDKTLTARHLSYVRHLVSEGKKKNAYRPCYRLLALLPMVYCRHLTTVPPFLGIIEKESRKGMSIKAYRNHVKSSKDRAALVLHLQPPILVRRDPPRPCYMALEWYPSLCRKLASLLLKDPQL